jgi:hypothetical protein
MAKLDQDAVLAAAENSLFGAGPDTGFCLACGAENYGVEPDAEGYECEECGESEVYGAEQLLLLGYVG